MVPPHTAPSPDPLPPPLPLPLNLTVPGNGPEMEELVPVSTVKGQRLKRSDTCASKGTLKKCGFKFIKTYSD